MRQYNATAVSLETVHAVSSRRASRFERETVDQKIACLVKDCVLGSARRWWRVVGIYILSNAYEHFSLGKVVICREGDRVRM